jgi:hypothetical protein
MRYVCKRKIQDDGGRREKTETAAGEILCSSDATLGKSRANAWRATLQDVAMRRRKGVFHAERAILMNLPE